MSGVLGPLSSPAKADRTRGFDGLCGQPEFSVSLTLILLSASRLTLLSSGFHRCFSGTVALNLMLEVDGQSVCSFTIDYSKSIPPFFLHPEFAAGFC